MKAWKDVEVGGTYCVAGELSEHLYLCSESWNHLSEVRLSAGISRIQILTRLCLQSLQEVICILLLENRSTLIHPYSMFCVVAPGWGTDCELLEDDERETKKDA